MANNKEENLHLHKSMGIFYLKVSHDNCSHQEPRPVIVLFSSEVNRFPFRNPFISSFVTSESEASLVIYFVAICKTKVVGTQRLLAPKPRSDNQAGL